MNTNTAPIDQAQTPATVPEFCFDTYGYAVVPELAEIEPLLFPWCAVAGYSYLLNILPALEYNDRLGHDMAEMLRVVMDGAHDDIAHADKRPHGDSRRSAAVEVLSLIAGLAGIAIRSGQGRAYLEQERANFLALLEEDALEKHRSLAAKAMRLGEAGT